MVKTQIYKSDISANCVDTIRSMQIMNIRTTAETHASLLRFRYPFDQVCFFMIRFRMFACVFAISILIVSFVTVKIHCVFENLRLVNIYTKWISIGIDQKLPHPLSVSLVQKVARHSYNRNSGETWEIYGWYRKSNG